MKKLFIIFLFFIFQSSFLNNNCLAQFQSDVRLTNDTSISRKCYNNARSIAAIGDFVHVVWEDFIWLGHEDIYYKRSTDRGITWSSDIHLVANPSATALPAIAVDGPIVHVVWEDVRTDEDKIFYKRSSDNGLSWGPDVQISHGTIWESNFPSISISGSDVHVVWEDERYGPEIYYERSTDKGLTWGAETRLTFDPDESLRPCVSASGQVVHVVWTDLLAENQQIYYKRSDDGGTTWGANTRFTTDSTKSSNPSVSSYGSLECVVWQNIRYGWEIYAKISTNAGLTWGPDIRLTENPYNSFYPNVTVSGANIHVVWQDVRDGNWEIYYKLSTDAGLTWGADERLTNAPFDSFYPSVTVSGTIVHVNWQDNRDGNYEIYYKRDSTGNPIGIKSISSEIPKSYNLLQNYPNPFNPSTNIEFSLPKSSNVELAIFDVLGRKIATLVNQQLNTGSYLVDWNATDFPSGIYFYRLIARDYIETRKMVLNK